MNIRLLTAREVEQMLRYSSGHATRLAKAGKLPYLTLPDGEIRFDEAEIEKLIKQRQRAYRTTGSGQEGHSGRAEATIADERLPE